MEDAKPAILLLGGYLLGAVVTTVTMYAVHRYTHPKEKEDKDGER